MGLESFYEILETVIRGKNGTEFVFHGLSNQTIQSIKSFEGIDIAWCEEAQVISKRSWDILIPTIRKPGSEIWVSFNPELDTDDTFVRFVLSPPPDALISEVNYHDNPWFPDVLEQERQHCQLTQSAEDYNNIWEGKPRSAVAGAIYAREIADSQTHGRVCNVPYDPMLKVHVVCDLGWNDAMTLALCQRVRSEIRVIGYFEDSHKTLDYYSSRLKEHRYNWGMLFLPHDGRAKNVQTGKSAEEVFKRLGWEVRITPDVGVEPGIKMARQSFHQVFFDKTSTGRLIECLKRYRRQINQATNEPGAPLHDEYSHGADCFRYMAINADRMTNEMDDFIPQGIGFSPLNAGMGY
jgi:phage terminase large subunit